MRPVFYDTSIPENNTKNHYDFPEFIMMENAAAELEKTVLELIGDRPLPKILILCGNGNNGGDGLALARRLFGALNITVFLSAEPKTMEAQTQYKMARALQIPFVNQKEIAWNSYSLIVDCIFGTGFHGEFTAEIQDLFINANHSKAIKLACDVPSGLSKDGKAANNTFRADYTVTMGALKTALFSDEAKNLCGKVTVADLGINHKIFENQGNPDAFLIENEDVQLPLRKNKSSHKGTFGHTLIYAGEKSGAAILSATAAMKFGSGLTTLLRTPESNLDQFKISPSLMISNKLPDKTTAVVIGNGLGNADLQTLETFTDWFKSAKNPACVIDADLFSYKNLPAILHQLCNVPNGKIVLTPHPKELQTLANNLKLNERYDYSVQEIVSNRINIGKEICKIYPALTLVLKSANTFIITSEKVYICDSGSPALSKGGSGDVLAGMIGGLLAQGYSAEPAAITAVYVHGLVSQHGIFGTEDFSITSEDLINGL